MDPDKIAEATRLAGMLYEAVRTLKPAEFETTRQVYRMALAMAQVEVLSARAQHQAALAPARA